MAYLQFARIRKQGWTPAAYGTNETTGFWSVQIGDLIAAAFMRVEAAFDGTSPSCSIGDDGDVDRFMTTTNTGIDTTGLKRGTGAGFTETLGFLYTAANNVDIVFTAATGSPTVGRLTAWAYKARVEPN